MFVWIYILCLVASTVNAQSRRILGYTSESCDSLEPVYMKEDFSHLSLGPQKDGEEESDPNDSLDRRESPARYTSRNPPVQIKIDFNQYRRKREYKIQLQADKLFDGFMLQVRGRKDDDPIYVGDWKMSNGISRVIPCGSNIRSTIISKKRPIQYGNMTFYWKAPSSGAGPLKIYASIIYQNAYFVLSTPTLRFNSFPVNLKNCGRTMSCFRYCKSKPFCDSEAAEYVVTMSADPENPELILFKLGGYLKNDQDYIALGFGYDKHFLKNMDIVTCYKDENDRISMSHFLLENSENLPYVHRSRIPLDSSDYDEKSKFVWCQFRRPLNPNSVYDLNFSSRLYRFYFWGKMNESRFQLPPLEKVIASPLKLNISDEINDVRFGESRSTANRGSESMLILFTLKLLLKCV